jgi:hypothetical protein
VLLAEGEGDEVAELDQLGLFEVGVQLRPQLVVRVGRAPGDGVRQRSAARWRSSKRSERSKSISSSSSAR